jgi:hypothetical protein
MKKLAVIILALPLFLAGCKPAPLPTGAINGVDAALNANLQAAHAAVLQYEADVKAGLHTPTVAERTAVNNIIGSLNIADPLYQAWHAQLQKDPTTPESAQLIGLAADISSELNAIENLVKGTN